MRFFGKKHKATAPKRPAPVPQARPTTTAPQHAPRVRESNQPAEPEKKMMGQMLVEEGIVSTAQLNEGLERQKTSGKRVVECLVELGYVQQDAFRRFMARQPGVASIDLDNYQIPRDLIAMIPRDFAEKNQVFPIDKLGKLLTVGMACPLDQLTIDELHELTGLRVKALLCSLEDIRAYIEHYYPKSESAATG